MPNIAPLDPADKRAPPPVKKICVRCKKERSAIILQTAAFCHQCFQFNFEGKVRLGLEQSRLCTYLHRTEQELQHQQQQSSGSTTSLSQSPKQAQAPPSSSNLPISSTYPCKGRVAIGFSGGASSRTLLHIAKSRLLRSEDGSNGVSGKSGKLQEVEAIDVIYVDDSCVIDGAEDRTEEIREIIKQEGGEEQGIHYWPLRLCDVFDDGKEVECSAEYAASRYMSKRPRSILDDKSSSLQSLFRIVQPSDTPKGMLSNARSRSEDLLSIFTSHLLRRQAIRLGASCLMTGETSTRMAVSILESVGKGRGHKLPVEQGSIRWNGLFILRPLKDVGAKEVTLYSRGKDLTSLPSLNIVAAQLLASGGHDASNGDKASMARLTESLIHLLEKNVPSTVSTVNKVGDKLVFSNDSASHGYDDDGGLNGSVGCSSLSFHQVGPSVPIRLRKRQDSTSSDISRLNLNGLSTFGEAGDRSLQGLGLGRLGNTLYVAAKRMALYNGALACPLCQMPSQRGLHAWKRGLTISLTQEEKTRQVMEDEINLTRLLCYACTMVLDTPENIKERTTMALPSFVLEGSLRRLKEEATLDEKDISMLESLLDTSTSKQEMVEKKKGDHAHGLEQKQVLHKLDRDQMKQHLNGFLLDDEQDGQNDTTAAAAAAPSSQQRERRQTDW
ncbi:hypothetical protein CBS101457_003549 [Exobasidium rhododendri]|nr:hypothetical protein CBS101457_003549 [Exobasidium rhododendri]